MMEIMEYLKLAPMVREAPHRYLWSSYDEEADTPLYQFQKPSRATDSEITDDDVIIRHEGDEVIGITLLQVIKR